MLSTGPISPEQIRTNAELIPAQILPLFDELFIRSGLLYGEYVRRLGLQVLRESGLHAAASQEGTAGEIGERAGLDPQRARVPVQWLLRYLAGRGDIERTWMRGQAPGRPVPAPIPEEERLAGSARAIDSGGERFRSTGPLPDLDPNEPLEEQRALAPAWLPSYRVAEVAAAGYPAFLRGEQSGEEILFAPDRLDLWSGYFSNDNGLYAVNNRIGAIAVDLWLGAPADSLLEIGGGLGSAALAVLDRFGAAGRLGEISKYRFTEMVPAFLRKGQKALRDRFPEAAFLSFSRLDMDKPFEEQGVAPGSISLVYAVNTVHVARDLRFTLGQIRSSLTPGGLLVLAECMLPRRGEATYVEFIFNLLEPFRRHGGGFLTPEQWDEELEAAGFADVRFLPDLRILRERIPDFYASAVGATPRVGSSQKG